jgi:hypothetical protein
VISVVLQTYQNEKMCSNLGEKKNSLLKENNDKYDPAETEMDLA